jgi:hypothetical protein
MKAAKRFAYSAGSPTLTLSYGMRRRHSKVKSVKRRENKTPVHTLSKAKHLNPFSNFFEKEYGTR